MKPTDYIKGIITVAVIVVILFIPIMPVDVTYSETEPYNRLAKYEVVSATLTSEFELFGRGVYHRTTIILKNVDSLGGTFTVKHSLYDINGLFGKDTTSGYIEAGSIQNFVAEFDTSLGQDVRAEYFVTAPIVIDQRVITKHKTVYKSIIELLIYG